MGSVMSESENKLEVALFSAVTQTIETMTFEEAELVEQANGAEIAVDMMWAALPILRPYAGQLVLHVTPEYGKRLAEEIYSNASEAISEETVTDVVTEVADIIAGRFMDELVPHDAQFSLGLPIVGVGDFPKGFEEVSSIVINVGGYPLVASVSGYDFVEQQACE